MIQGRSASPISTVSSDYLYIAPERLAVPGFPEMLAKRTPVAGRGR